MRVVAILVAAAIFAGCGGAQSASHLDPRSDAVVAIDMDYDGSNWQQIKRLYARAVGEGGLDGGEFTPPTLDGAFGVLASATGLSFPDDIRPLLGGELRIGVDVAAAPPLPASARDVLERLDEDASDFDRDPPRYVDFDGKPLDTTEVEAAYREQDRRQPSTTVTAEYQVKDAGALERVLEKLRGQGLESKPIEGIEDAQRLGSGIAVVGGDTLIAVITDDDDQADAQLRKRLESSDDAPDLPELDGQFLAANVTPAVLGGWLDQEALRRALASTPGKALRGAQVGLEFDADAARATARVDFDGLADEDLPLPAPGPLALPAAEGVSSASANQSSTTVFLARLARELFPESRFVRRVERLEAREGLRFEDEVLRQFSGPSLSILRPQRDGTVAFAARSTLRDPAAMRALLDRIAPDLPGILEGLQGLGSTGLTSLLLVAPDAPLTPAALGLLAAVDVRRLVTSGSEQLYEITGLDTDTTRPGPDRVVYGLVGDVFVVASTQELARAVAKIPTKPAPEAATRVRLDIAALLANGAVSLGEDEERALRALVAGAEISASAKDGDIVTDAVLRWAR